jgi:protein-arginine kinase activator protein McsA
MNGYPYPDEDYDETCDRCGKTPDRLTRIGLLWFCDECYELRAERVADAQKEGERA